MTTKSRPKQKYAGSPRIKIKIKNQMSQIKLGIDIVLLVGLLALGVGCASIPMALMFNDPLSIDPGVFRMAVTGEAPLKLKKKGAQLTLSYTVSTPTTYVPESFEERYDFEEDTSPFQDEALKKEKEVHVYRLEPQAAKALRIWQEKLKQHRAAGGDGKGSMAIGLSQGCRKGSLPQGPVYVGLYGKTQANAGFFLLAPRFDLRNFSWEEAGEKRTVADLPLCED